MVSAQVAWHAEDAVLPGERGPQKSRHVVWSSGPRGGIGNSPGSQRGVVTGPPPGPAASMLMHSAKCRHASSDGTAKWTLSQHCKPPCTRTTHWIAGAATA